MQTPLPAELFYNDNQNVIRFKKSINIDLGIAPIRITWLPFFDQMSQQLTRLIKKSVGKNFLRAFDYSLWHESGLHKGTPYMKSMVNGINIEVDYYCGCFIKRHINGFAYGKLSIIPIIGNGKEDMWIRWKSNLADYQYIEPDDELNLRLEDITFEICTEIPENLAQEFYGNISDELNLSTWIELLNDETHYPQKPKYKAVANNFAFEISPDCDYPDVCFTIFLHDKPNCDLEGKIENAFWEFLGYYNVRHKDKIHDIINVKDMVEYPSIINDENVIQLHVDFGNSSPQAIEKLVDWFRDYNFDIKKIILM